MFEKKLCHSKVIPLLSFIVDKLALNAFILSRHRNFLKEYLGERCYLFVFNFLTSCHRNQTRDGWVGSANATSGLCSPHLVLDVKKLLR